MITKTVTTILEIAPSTPKMVIPRPNDTSRGTPTISKIPVRIRAEINFANSGRNTPRAKLLLLKTNSLLVTKAKRTAQIQERIFAMVIEMENDIPRSETSAFFSPKESRTTKTE